MGILSIHCRAESAMTGKPIHVVRAEGKIFIVAAEGNVTETGHHDHHHD